MFLNNYFNDYTIYTVSNLAFLVIKSSYVSFYISNTLSLKSIGTFNYLPFYIVRFLVTSLVLSNTFVFKSLYLIGAVSLSSVIL